MALAHYGPIEIQTAPGSSSVGTNPVFHYDTRSDQLIFKLDSNRRQSFSYPVNDVVSLLYDDDADETIGIQIDGFATNAIHRFPDLMAIAKVLAIVPRAEDDDDLFREGRIVGVRQDVSEADEAAFKTTLRQIINVTGGFDEDITIVRT